MYEVVWPRGRKTVGIDRLAKRLDTLEGKTVCELWDWMFRGDEIFPMIEKELAKRYPGIKFINYEVFFKSYDEFCSVHGAEKSKVLAVLRDKLRQHKCDAVISGVGC